MARVRVRVLGLGLGLGYRPLWREGWFCVLSNTGGSMSGVV